MSNSYPIPGLKQPVPLKLLRLLSICNFEKERNGKRVVRIGDYLRTALVPLFQRKWIVACTEQGDVAPGTSSCVMLTEEGRRVYREAIKAGFDGNQ